MIDIETQLDLILDYLDDNELEPNIMCVRFEGTAPYIFYSAN